MDEQERLTKAYQSNKLSHAYLFEGDDGQTMQQVAIDFTKLILCNGDYQCQLKVETFNHPDFMYVSSEETTIKKDQVEQLVHHMNQLPIEGDYKVYIIESFEKLTVQGENSILKFFEVAVTLNEETDLMALRKSVVKWCQLLLTNRSMALIAIVDLLKQAKNRKLQLVTLAAVNGFFEDVMHAKVGMDQDMIYHDLKEDIKAISKKLTYNQIILMYDQITEAHKKLNQNVNPMLVFEQIVINGVN